MSNTASAREVMVNAGLWGTWRLEHAVERDLETGTLSPPPYGPEPLGFLSFTPQGRMVSIVYDARATLPVGQVRAYTSYCGAYHVDGKCLTTMIDAAADPARVGTAQVRMVEQRGDRLIVRPPPRGSGTQRELTWRKIEGSEPP